MNLPQVTKLGSRVRTQILNQEWQIIKPRADFSWHIPNTGLKPHLWFLAQGRHGGGRTPVPLGDQGPRNYPSPAASAWVTPSNGVFALGTFEGRASIQRAGELLGPQRCARKYSEAQTSWRSCLVSVWDCVPHFPTFLIPWLPLFLSSQLETSSGEYGSWHRDWLGEHYKVRREIYM